MVMVDLSGASLTLTADARGFFGVGDGDVPRLLGSSGEGVESAEAFFLCDNIMSIHVHDLSAIFCRIRESPNYL
jgi:hypothetical protein